MAKVSLHTVVLIILTRTSEEASRQNKVCKGVPVLLAPHAWPEMLYD